MTENRFHIINDAGNLQKYGIFCKPVVVDNETDKKYILALDLLDLLNNQHEEIQRLEIDLEDMVDIKNKYKKESEKYYEMFLDFKKQLSRLGDKYVANGVTLRTCLQKHYHYAENQRQKNLDNVMVHQVYDMLRITIKDIADELGVELNEGS